MQLIELRVQNFLSLETAVLMFRQGLHFVNGKNWDMGADEDESNGSGKSSLFEAIQWCLFGSLARGKVLADAVVNTAAGMNCAVQLVFEHNDHRYDVLRTRKHEEYGSGLQVWKDGVPLTQHVGSDTEFDLTNELPINETIFRYAVQVGQGMPDRFLSLSEPDKHDLICKIINLSVFDQALANARANAKAEALSENVAKETLANLDSQHSQWDAALAVQWEELKTYQTNEASRLKEARNSEVAFSQQAETYAGEIMQLNTEIEALTSEAEELESKCALVAQRVESAVAEVTCRHGDITARYNDVTSITSQITRLTDDIREATEQPNKCVLCSKIPDFNAASSCENLKIHIQEKQAEQGKLSTLYEQRCAEYKPLHEAYENFRAEADTLEKYRVDLQDKSRALRTRTGSLARDVTVRQDRKEGFLRRVSEVTHEISQHEQVLAGMEARIKQTSEMVSDLKVRIATETQKRDNCAVSALHWKYWADNIPNLRASAVSKILIFVNGRIDHYMQVLSSGAMGMELYQKAHGKSSKIQVDLRTPGGTYVASSGGERRRVDLAVFLALFDLLQVSSGVKFNVLVCDEIVDSLSPSGVRQFLKILQDKANEGCAVYVISHNPSVQQAIEFDTILTVERKGGKAVLTNETQLQEVL